MAKEPALSSTKGLSAKHRAFVDAYLQLWNATEAYSRVYPKASRETARRNGSLLLTNTDIDAEINARLAERAMSADEVLDRLSEQARAAYSQYLTARGTVDLERLIADGKAHLIKRIKHTQFGVNVEFYDAHAARELLGKYHKLWTDKVNHEVMGEIELRVVYDGTVVDDPSA
jgi:phage terminase small subunit